MPNSNLSKNRSEFLVLKADHGDAIIVKTFDASGNPFNIVVDGGTAKTFDNILNKEFAKLDEINLAVLTHIDSDHIAGLIKYLKHRSFKAAKIKRYWFNAGNIRFINLSDKISFNQGRTFEELLITKGEINGRLDKLIAFDSKLMLAEGITAEILSPTTEILDKLFEKWPLLSDTFRAKLKDVTISGSVTSQLKLGPLEDLAKQEDIPEKTVMGDLMNSSSIAFVLRTPDVSILLLGDAHPEVIVGALRANHYKEDNKLKVDYVKIAHHGSKNNTMNELLDLIDCQHFIISTNGGNATHKHPDRETIARIVHHPERVKNKYSDKRTIYFNYPLSQIEKKAGRFLCDEDFSTGNWEIVDNKTLFSHG